MEVRGPLVWMFLMCYIFGHIIISHNTDLVEAKRFSKFEDLEIVKRLKTINKPAIKIIKTIHGERYGCVDFFKQPAFDHPSMKNHTYHYNMRRRVRETKTNSTGFGYLWENGVGCPIGTVPIRRVTKDDLLRLDSIGDNHKPRASWNASTTYDPNNNGRFDQNHYAVVRTKKNVGMKFNGATMEVCVTAPKVEPTQFSSSRFHMQMGNDFIQVGLTVNPGLYKDNQPRTFVYTSAVGKHCFNSNCPVGIILVRQDFPFGIPITDVSHRGSKTSTYATMGLIKDQRNGNWWLELGGDAIEVGFWPSNRFPQSFGNYIEWGGEVYRHSESLPRPEMGFGKLPRIMMNYDAYIRHIIVLDGNFNIDHNVKYVEEFNDEVGSYAVVDVKSPLIPHDGHLIFFGGPGGA